MLTTRIRALLARAGNVGAWIGDGGARFARAAWAFVRSEQLRERLMATGAFAALALIAAASLDFLVNGGPDWSQNAEAAPFVANGGFVTLAALPDVPYVPAAAPPVGEASAPMVVYVVASEELLGGPLDGYQPVALAIGGLLAEASEDGQLSEIGLGADLMMMQASPF